ncbi:hypothetical protein GOP47_0023710 [Adiantum capillus-veneris]|uniref:RRM domain-containing protein n=1 Tax=Adiantum capillus-veneris TaxID=13818 RepID=A0A9D4U4H5_ADICA|nr:hypothetical protein GOP47_0023710 [Adiantum capillus-veneris]
MSHFGRSGPPDISDTYSLLVLNITFRTSADDLYPLFDRYGKVVDIFIPRDRRTGESRGFAFVRYKHVDEAQKAVDRLDGRTVDGRDIMVQFAKYGPNAESISHGRISADMSYRSPRRSRYRDEYYRDYRYRSRSRSRSRDRNGRDRYKEADKYASRKRRRSRSRSISRSPSRSRSPVRHRNRSYSRSPSRSTSPVRGRRDVDDRPKRKSYTREESPYGKRNGGSSRERSLSPARSRSPVRARSPSPAPRASRRRADQWIHALAVPDPVVLDILLLTRKGVLARLMQCSKKSARVFRCLSGAVLVAVVLARDDDDEMMMMMMMMIMMVVGVPVFTC